MIKRVGIIPKGTTLYRFGATGTNTEDMLSGAWWIDQKEFNKLMSFAQQHDISVGLAIRARALIPPQWSDMARLARVSTRLDLLAIRRLGESVRVEVDDGLGDVRMPHYNANPARRLFQHYIPELYETEVSRQAFIMGNIYDIDSANRGFIYT